MPTTSVRPRHYSVSLLTSLLAAAAIAMGMAVYGVAQYAADPSLSPATLLIEHTAHVVVLWLLVYTCVVLTLHRVLLKPIRKIYVHLYGVGAGRLKPLRLHTSIRELAQIVEGINVMIQRMDIGPEGNARACVQEVAHNLRQVARERATHDVDLATRLTKASKQLEHALGALHAEF